MSSGSFCDKLDAMFQDKLYLTKIIICRVQSLKEFEASLLESVPPEGLSDPLKALWLDAKGDWERAHACVESLNNQKAAWVHAYLHRKDGDLSNASYWYARAGRSVYSGSLTAEWERIAEILISKG